MKTFYYYQRVLHVGDHIYKGSMGLGGVKKVRKGAKGALDAPASSPVPIGETSGICAPDLRGQMARCPPMSQNG